LFIHRKKEFSFIFLDQTEQLLQISIDLQNIATLVEENNAYIKQQ